MRFAFETLGDFRFLCRINIIDFNKSYFIQAEDFITTACDEFVMNLIFSNIKLMIYMFQSNYFFLMGTKLTTQQVSSPGFITHRVSSLVIAPVESRTETT